MRGGAKHINAALEKALHWASGLAQQKCSRYKRHRARREEVAAGSGGADREGGGNSASGERSTRRRQVRVAEWPAVRVFELGEGEVLGRRRAPARGPPDADRTAAVAEAVARASSGREALKARREASIRRMPVLNLKVALLELELPIDGLKPALLARLLQHHGLGGDGVPADGAPSLPTTRALRSRA